jgi:hypothetical protein
MAKVAKLVYVSMVTRVVVEDTATDEEIIDISTERFIDKLKTEIGEHIETIEDDIECPYDEDFDVNF